MGSAFDDQKKKPKSIPQFLIVIVDFENVTFFHAELGQTFAPG